jgi:hypothetical protein
VRTSIVHSIPGGWYGNDPGSTPGDPKAGTVVVDPSRSADAIYWLIRYRRVKLVAVRQMDDGGILLSYQRR